MCIIQNCSIPAARIKVLTLHISKNGLTNFTKVFEMQ